MIGIIYKQSYNYHTKAIPINKIKRANISLEEIEEGFTKIGCDDCDSTGEFPMPNGIIEVCVLQRERFRLYEYDLINK